MTAEPGGRQAVRYSYLVLWASLLLMFISTGSVYLLIVALKPIAQDFDWPRTVPSLAYSILFVGSGIGAIFMGHWLDRSGMGPPALLGGIMFGVGSLIVYQMSGAWEFLVAYGLFYGLLGQATMYSPLMANGVKVFHHRPGFATGVVSAGQSLAGMIWPPLARYFNDWVGWRETYFWYAVFVFCTMIPLSFVFFGQRRRGLGENLAPAGATGDAPATQDVAGLTPAGWTVVLSIAVVGCCIAMSLPLAHMVSHVTDIGFPAARAAEMLSVMLLTATITRMLLLGPVCERLGSLQALFLFSAGQAATLGLLVMVEDIVALYLVSALFGLGYGGVLPCYPVILRQYASIAGIGRRTATIIFLGGSGMAIGGWLGGYLFELTGGYFAAFMTGVATNVANLAIVGVLIYRFRQAPVVAAS